MSYFSFNKRCAVPSWHVIFYTVLTPVYISLLASISLYQFYHIPLIGNSCPPAPDPTPCRIPQSPSQPNDTFLIKYRQYHKYHQYRIFFKMWAFLQCHGLQCLGNSSMSAKIDQFCFWNSYNTHDQSQTPPSPHPNCWPILSQTPNPLLPRDLFPSLLVTQLTVGASLFRSSHSRKNVPPIGQNVAPFRDVPFSSILDQIGRCVIFLWKITFWPVLELFADFPVRLLPFHIDTPANIYHVQ